ncbi:MAG TPA: GNAT family N-acetyltransferase [Candidatus Methylomirabilis sp.]|nr:GNAT family N-acetyltransferase [Candidatus Methylomirabilis sp.]
MWSIESYESSRHERQVHALWLKTFGERWSIDRQHLARVFPPGTPCFVAVERRRPVGFVGTVPSASSVAVILVDEGHRRRGIARALFLAALESLRQGGCARATVGGVALLWKGVPVEFRAANRFIAGLGCTPSARTVDQFRYLADYEYPAHLDGDLARRGLRLAAAVERDAEPIRAFESTHFPRWAEFFSAEIARRQFARILCVRSDAEIVGTALVYGRDVPFPGAQWVSLARRGLGGYATLGIAPAHRGLGLGYALSAFATQRVKESGAEGCLLNQSDAVPLYEKLGFREWAEYQAYEIWL